jgi:hypothetical protein
MTDLFSHRDQGTTLRNNGMDQAFYAEERDSDWCGRFRAEILRIASRQEFVHVNDLLGFDEPRHKNAAGPIWQSLVREKKLAWTNTFQQCLDPKKRRRQSPIYRSLIWGGA